jgi:hypothetical protein
MGKTQSTGNLTNALAQDSSNNIGIGGAANASYKLQVTGATNLTGALSGTSATFSSSIAFGQTISVIGTNAILYHSTNNNLYIQGGSDGIAMYSDGSRSNASYIIDNINKAHVFGTNSAERMRITSNGIIQLSTTTTIPSDNNTFFSYSTNGFLYLQGGSTGLALTGSGNRNNAIYINSSLNQIQFNLGDGTSKVVINSSGAATFSSSVTATAFGGAFSITAQGAGANGISDGPFIRYINTTNSYQILKQINTSTDEDTWSYRGSWNKIGTLNGVSGVYTALSDINKKKDFEDSTIGLNAILSLKPTLYRMKDEDETSQKQLGFIAQEVKDFIPQAYVEQENFIGLQDRPIIAALVKAVQEQQAQIEELKQIVATK